MSKNREGYGFPKSLREIRKENCGNVCEHCGKQTSADLQGHHLVPVFLARHNPLLTIEVICSIENAQMLCSACHHEADDAHKQWDAKEIGIIAWALFDLDPQEVAEAQGSVEPENRISRKNRRRANAQRRKNKKIKTRQARRAKKRVQKKRNR